MHQVSPCITEHSGMWSFSGAKLMQDIVGHMDRSLCLGLYSVTMIFELNLCVYCVSVALAVAH